MVQTHTQSETPHPSPHYCAGNHCHQSKLNMSLCILTHPSPSPSMHTHPPSHQLGRTLLRCGNFMKTAMGLPWLRALRQVEVRGRQQAGRFFSRPPRGPSITARKWPISSHKYWGAWLVNWALRPHSHSDCCRAD